MLSLDPSTTALVLIDLQKGIVAMPTQPRSGEAVVAAAGALADRFRRAGAPVVLVNVAFSPDGGDLPPAAVDQPLRHPPGGFPAGFSEIADGLAYPSDLRLTKRHWGAFHGTEMDLQLRRRGIRTIVLAGIATNFGVEGTAREAWQHGYDVVIAEDATAATSAELHDTAMRFILPRLARVRSSAEISLAEIALETAR